MNDKNGCFYKKTYTPDNQSDNFSQHF